MFNPPENYVTITHSIGEGACGKTAFYYSGIMAPDEVAHSDRALLVDGTQPSYGSQLRCGSCGIVITFVGSDGNCGILN
jgi:hypothetical protein